MRKKPGRILLQLLAFGIFFTAVRQVLHARTTLRGGHIFNGSAVSFLTDARRRQTDEAAARDLRSKLIERILYKPNGAAEGNTKAEVPLTAPPASELLAPALAPGILGIQRVAEEAVQQHLTLWHWVLQRSKQEPRVSVATVCDGDTLDHCRRGLTAILAIEAGDVIVDLPKRSLLRLPDASAEGLMDQLHGDNAFNATWKPYLDTWPPVGSLLTPATMTEPELQLLQGGALEHAARAVNARVAREFNAHDVLWKSAGIQLAFFAHVQALIDTRHIIFGKEMVMAPLVDMANHAEVGIANAAVKIWADQGGLSLIALMNISSGAEVTVSQGQLVRSDQALFSLGHLLPRPMPPLLLAVDYGGTPGNMAGLQASEFPDQFRRELPQDDAAYTRGGALATAAELKRLKRLAASLPTTEHQDRTFLQITHGTLAWRKQALLKLGIWRKEALRRVMRELQASLTA